MVLVITFIATRKEKTIPPRKKPLTTLSLLSNHALRLTSLKWSTFLFSYYKMDKKSIVNDLYHASLISVFAVGYSILRKKIPKMVPPSTQKFDLEDTENWLPLLLHQR